MHDLWGGVLLIHRSVRRRRPVPLVAVWVVQALSKTWVKHRKRVLAWHTAGQLGTWQPCTAATVGCLLVEVHELMPKEREKRKRKIPGYKPIGH